MIGMFSASAGIICVPKKGTDEYAHCDVLEEQMRDSIEAQYLQSGVQDWEVLEGDDAESLLKVATGTYHLERVVSLIRLILQGLEKSLQKEVLEHIEELLQTRVLSETVLNRLLVAPLKDAGRAFAPAECALSFGYSAVASILDELVDLQVPLRRLTEYWLALPDAMFMNLGVSRQQVWTLVAKECGIKELVTAASRQAFTGKWNVLVLHLGTPQSRRSVSKIGAELSSRLFPGETQTEAPIYWGREEETTLPAEAEQVVCIMKPHEVHERVQKQIGAIAQAVSQGYDTKAEKFLRELVEEQTSYIGGESYAVMSLCNIAKRCADMFRMDYERICLDEALKVSPHDTWALIQYGDHLKRIGQYEDALRVFSEAQRLGEGCVAISATADVYAQQGQYEKAIEVYRTIPDWECEPTVLTGIADNLRRMGRVEDARQAYNELLGSSGREPLQQQSELRAYAGLAEIAKTEGKLEEALSIYKSILKRGVQDKDTVIYQLAQCNILKLMERYDDAYSIVDMVIHNYPFAMQARFARGAILGLLGRESEGLKDLREGSSSRSWQEWLRRYYRGLLLFKLQKYEDARANLVEELPKAIASGEERAILCMGATLYFLKESATLEADKLLASIHDLQDKHVQYLALVLKLHLAAQKKDLTVVADLTAKINRIEISDANLKKAVVAIKSCNYALALRYETEALLKLAA